MKLYLTKIFFFCLMCIMKKTGQIVWNIFDIETAKPPDNPSCQFRAATLGAAANRSAVIS